MEPNTTFLNVTNTTRSTTQMQHEDAISLMFHFLVLVVSFTGNSLVIAIVYKNTNKRMRTTANMFVVNMAASDLLTTLFSIPIDIVILTIGQWPFPRESTASLALCKAFFGTWYLSSGISLTSLVAIALDRFWAVFFPTKRPLTTRNPPAILVSIWLLCLVFEIPLLLETKIFTMYGRLTCLPNYKSTSVYYHYLYFTVFGGSPTIVIVFLYPAILVKLWRRRIPGNPSVANQELRDRTNFKVSVMAIALMLSYMISWFPFLGEYISEFRKQNSQVDERVAFVPITFAMPYLTCSLSPLICIAINGNFRSSIKSVLQLQCCSDCKCTVRQQTANNMQTRHVDSIGRLNKIEVLKINKFEIKYS